MKLKQVLGLIIGLVVGVTGGVMFMKSLPPEEGSLEDQYELATTRLASAERRLMAYQRYERSGMGRSRDEMRNLVLSAKEGEDLSPDDLFRVMKPWMRDMTPIFERVRQVNAEDWADTKTAEWSRLYDLDEGQRKRLKEWFEVKIGEREDALIKVIQSDQSGFVDFIKATEYGWKDEIGVEPMMEEMLEGGALEKFREDRLNERAESVQNEADRHLSRLDALVYLDDEQHRKMFGVLSRSARDYTPEVGEKGEAALDLPARNAAIDQILRPDQLQTLNEHRQNRRAEAESNMRRIGMTLPDNWDALERSPF